MATSNPVFGGIAELLGIASGDQLRARAGRMGEVRVAESFLIDKPVGELFGIWRDFGNIPRILPFVERVEVLDERRSRWTIHAPRGKGEVVVLDVRITEERPGELLGWEAQPGPDLEHRGLVRFEGSPRGTRMRAELEFRARGGGTSVDVAKFLGPSPAAHLKDDLRAWKRVVEVGEAPTVEGQPRGTCAAHAKKEQSS